MSISQMLLGSNYVKSLLSNIYMYVHYFFAQYAVSATEFVSMVLDFNIPPSAQGHLRNSHTIQIPNLFNTSSRNLLKSFVIRTMNIK